MEWLKPQVTKNITGAHAPINRPMVSLAPRLSSTPMVTSTLHRKPMKKAFWKGMVILPSATFMAYTASALFPADSQPNLAHSTATRREPMKLPMYTNSQSFSMAVTRTFFSSTLMKISVLPVNSSAPIRITMPRPKANSSPEMARMVLLLSRP